MSNDYIHITPATLAVHAIERAALEVHAAANDKPDRWWFAITDAHQALTAALVETLVGTAGIGAYDKPLQRAWLDYYEVSRTDNSAKPPEDDRVLPFPALLDRAQDKKSRRDMGGTLVLTDSDKKDLRRLNSFRNDLDHVKPRGWSLEKAGLPRIIGAAAEAMRQLFMMHPLRIHLEENELERAEEALAVILRLAGRQ
jgi:hypothetical protein